MIERRPSLCRATFLLPDDDPLPDYDTASGFRIALMGLSLVDAERASWNQIIEFRKDQKSRASLRRLHIFMAEEYCGKDKAYMEDDLLLRIDEYNNVVRDWGFGTRSAVISNLINSKLILGGLGGAIASSVLGKHWVAAASAVTGIAVELGNVVIDVSRRRYSLKTLRRNSPINFIVEARSQLAALGKAKAP
jgi:hypothetical protein